jgi:C-terminal processing protease CtpA/Prc
MGYGRAVHRDIAHDGPKAMLINAYSSSGGDALPYYFKKTGQGPLIGTRTWGGLIGISGNARLVDGGYISRATIWNIRRKRRMDHRRNRRLSRYRSG